MTTDRDYAFALGLVDRPGVAPDVVRELAASIVAYARERAAEELDRSAEWFAQLPDERLSRRTVVRFLREDADALATDDRRP